LKEPTVTGQPENDTAKQQPKQQNEDSGKGGKAQTDKDKEGPRNEPGHQREGGYDEA
jgi:hypothetical protein